MIKIKLDIRMRSEASRRDTWRVDHADWSTILRENFRLKHAIISMVKAHCSTNRPFFRRLLRTPPSFSSLLAHSLPPVAVTLSSSGSGILINPRRACAARVAVLGLCVCVCVCLLPNISLFTRLFVPQTILTFSAADEGRNFKRFSLKMLRCEARAYPFGTAT